ncbi:hypothetical protein [Flavobacterium suzhouense]|uniref:DUF2541 domain-containing protein n=1 Tax=Flavobacterium suzhouense TaxID=1529638 RepID=A0ABW5NNQ3_9FLAO
MKKSIFVFICIFFIGTVSAQRVARPRGGSMGNWRVLGTTHARHTADHDAIVVQGPYDNFRKIKFTVRDAPLNIRKMIVTFDGGGVQNIEVRYEIPKNGESREIDLRGGTKSIRRIDFWYDTRGILNGTADVTVYGKK